jgi:hypothetical protein
MENKIMRMQKSQLKSILAALVLSWVMAAPATGQAHHLPEPSLNDASGMGTLAVYQDFAKYPPESRPLRSWNWDLLHPWLTESPSLPMIPLRTMRQLKSVGGVGLSEEEMARAVVLPSPLPRYRFEMDKTILSGVQDELRARLTITPPEGTNTPLHIRVTKAELTGDPYVGSPSLGSVPFSCQAANPVCTFWWKAPAAEKKYWGTLELDVAVTVEGMADEFLFRQSFYSSPIVAGKFTGTFQERLDNGSLVIDAGVNVEKRMACFVSANLYSADKEVPTHFAQRRMIVDPSMKVISFLFFGKIFRDDGHGGAFRLQDLKAECQNLSYPPEWFIDSEAHQAELRALRDNPSATKEPTRIYFEYNTYSFVTSKYASSDFSDQEWQSPGKTRKIEALRKAASELDDPANASRKRH